MSARWKQAKGLPTRDKNDPKYKERYEREVEAGKRFADKCGISWGAKRLQEVGQEHKMAFLAIVFGFVIRDGVLYDECVLSDGCHATSGADKGDSHRAC